MVLELVLTGGLVLFQSFVVNKTGSIAVVAESLHYRWNILVNIAVIVSLFVASYGRVTYSDPLFTVAIVLCMGVGSWPVAATALDDLMDCEFPDGDRIKIREIAIQHPRAGTSMTCGTGITSLFLHTNSLANGQDANTH